MDIKSTIHSTMNIKFINFATDIKSINFAINMMFDKKNGYLTLKDFGVTATCSNKFFSPPPAS